MDLQALKTELEADIQETYAEGVTLSKAEALAAKFLKAQLLVSGQLRKLDLDWRMKKAGLKAVKAAAYSEAQQGKDKRPTEVQLEHALNTNKTVSDTQDTFDTIESNKLELERLYDIYLNAHIFYRGISKGNG